MVSTLVRRANFRHINSSLVRRPVKGPFFGGGGRNRVAVGVSGSVDRPQLSPAQI